MIKAPPYLTGEAAKFWKRHAKALNEAGVLTERDVESFALLCRIWSLLQGTDPDADPKMAIRFVGLTKQYQSLAKQFSLLPRDRKKDNISTEAANGDELLGW